MVLHDVCSLVGQLWNMKKAFVHKSTTKTNKQATEGKESTRETKQKAPKQPTNATHPCPLQTALVLLLAERSNTIDALLFVFGKRAKKMRLNKANVHARFAKKALLMAFGCFW